MLSQECQATKALNPITPSSKHVGQTIIKRAGSPPSISTLPNVLYACSVDSAAVMQLRACFSSHSRSICQLLSLCNYSANHGWECLGTCRTFMVTMWNCCRGELALWRGFHVGWHKRKLTLLAAASWRQEMGLWDSEEERGMVGGKKWWGRFEEERGHDYSSTMTLDGWVFTKADMGEETEDDRGCCITIVNRSVQRQPLPCHYILRYRDTSFFFN